MKLLKPGGHKLFQEINNKRTPKPEGIITGVKCEHEPICAMQDGLPGSPQSTGFQALILAMYLGSLFIHSAYSYFNFF
jgi:hypothetical protein